MRTDVKESHRNACKEAAIADNALKLSAVIPRFINLNFLMVTRPVRFYRIHSNGGP